MPAVVGNASLCEFKRRKLKLPAISIENERAMLKKFRNIAEACLKKYPQTYEEDIKLLKTELTYNERNCIIYRSGEKKIYMQMMEMGKLGLELLSMSYEQANKRFDNCKDGLHYRAYIEASLLPLLKKP